MDRRTIALVPSLSPTIRRCTSLDDTSPQRQSRVAAEKYSCSFTTEGLKELLIFLKDEKGQVFVLFVNSQSLLKALPARSINQIDAELEEIWKLLLKIGQKNGIGRKILSQHSVFSATVAMPKAMKYTPWGTL